MTNLLNIKKINLVPLIKLLLLTITGFLLTTYSIFHSKIEARPTTQPNHDNDKPQLAATKPKSLEVLPNFHKYKQTHTKKQAFFNYMRRLSIKANSDVLIARHKLQLLEKHQFSGKTILKENTKWLQNITKKYNINDFDVNKRRSWNKLLLRVDVIPTSMVLAQSANESAWGGSRFAQKGNNLFGQWCFTKGCGIVPKFRVKNATYEVRKFPTTLESVRAYIHNLNTSSSYQLFRAERAKLRKNNQKLSGYLLANGLNKYAENGQAYIKKIQQLIKRNNLEMDDNSEIL